jgi:hypothetical protein
MMRKFALKYAVPALVVAVLLVAPAVSSLYAQQNQAGRGAAAPSARAAAPVDLTGYWVSVVTEDWRWRMVTAKKGDHPSVPLNPEGVKVADSWDPAKDEASGEQCKAYGAAGLMRQPGRLHITWQDDGTLKIEMDTGMQTRLFHFLGPQAVVLASEGQPIPGVQALTAPSWQGMTVAQWEYAGGRGRGPQLPKAGDLQAVTTHMRAGYLQKNGVPYSPNAVLTEYFNRTDEPNGDSWLILVSTVVDPQYLNAPFFRSTHFKREPDGSKWDPMPCTAN